MQAIDERLEAWKRERDYHLRRANEIDRDVARYRAGEMTEAEIREKMQALTQQ